MEMSANGETYAFIELVINGITEPITVINSDFEIRWMNRAAREFLFGDGSFLKPFLCYECHHKNKNPCDGVEYACPLKRAGISREPLTVVHEHLRSDGQKRLLEIVCLPLWSKEGTFQGIIEVARDITERKMAEEALRHSEEYFRVLTENASDIITILEANGTIRYASFSAERVLGYKREDLIGRDIFELVHPDDVANARDTFTEGLQKPGVPLSLKVRYLHKNGTWRILEVIGENLLDNPAVGGIVVNSRDITEREHAVQELKQTTDELARSNADLLQFAYAASHDLQEPLRIIDGFIKLLAHRYKNKLDVKADEFIGYTLDGVERMRELIKDLLEYSKVGTKGIDLKPADFSLAVEKAVFNLKSTNEENGAVVTHDELPTVTVDISQMSSLLQNLISNAIKFHGMEVPRIHISAVREDNEWVFSVRDNGIGIDPKEAERIFVVFQRLHTREEYSGTGIGLAICKRIIERHGGRIWVESEPEKGSAFYFTIPDREVTTVQRRYQRIKKEIPFDFYYNQQHFTANTMDLSEGGLSIRILGRPSVKEHSIVDLSVEDLRIKAKVIWVKSLPDRSLVGLQKLN